MAIGAHFTLSIIHPGVIPSATLAVKAAAVELQSEFDHPAIALTIINDVTTAPTGTNVLRQFDVMFTPEFLASYSTDAAQKAAVDGLCLGKIIMGVPAPETSLTVTLIAVIP